MSEEKDPQLSDEQLNSIVQYALLTEQIKVEDPKKQEKLWAKIRRVVGNVRKASRRERIETVIAARILKKFLIEGKLTDEEKKFLKDQSVDLARILPLVAVQAVPAPVPITPFLIALGHKIGLDLVPKEQAIPEDYKKKEKPKPEEPDEQSDC